MVMLGQFLHIPRNFEIVHDRFQVSGKRFRCNSLKISVNGLKFGGMVYNTMERPIFARSMEHWNFLW